MTCRGAYLTVAAAATAIAFGSLAAVAAMPVGGPVQASADGDLVLAQAKKKKSKRQQEIDTSVESGTVPKRYRSSVPKQYHHLIPFATK
jgi:hypothetical protein